MAACYGTARGWRKDLSVPQQKQPATACGAGAIEVVASTWRTSVSVYMRADGTFFITAKRDGKRLTLDPSGVCLAAESADAP